MTYRLARTQDTVLGGRSGDGLGDGLGPLKRTKTATAPMLIPRAQVRAPSIERSGVPSALYEATRAGTADAAYSDVVRVAKPVLFHAFDASPRQLGWAALAASGSG